MLVSGIEQYAKQILLMHEYGEDASYCRLMTQTAMEEARNLRSWAEQVDPDYLQSTIKGLDELLVELSSQSDRFAALMAEELGT